MTTISWKDGVLACDKKASSGGTAFRCTKLFRTKTHAIAIAGSIAYGIKFVEWFKGDRTGECPLNGSKTGALVMNLETGKCEEWDEPGVGIPIEDKFAALGTGSEIAIGAMSFGASAIEAVECACEWDNDSGLGITYAKSRAHRRKQGIKKKD